MEETVSILFAVPAGQANDVAVQETLHGISSQTYPSSLVTVTQVQHVPGEPGAHTSALNAARESAKGSYVLQAEPGVVWDGNKIERQVFRLQETASAVASVHSMTARDPQGKTRSLGLGALRTYGTRIGCLLRPPWGPGAVMVRQEAFAKLGVFRNVDEVLWEYAVRLIFKGGEVDLLDEDLAVWNVDGQRQDAVSSVLRTLVPEGVRYRFLKSYLGATEAQNLFAGTCEELFAQLVLAGLNEKNDDLEVCHSICQEVGAHSDCGEASYWHGVVHRREPDFENARGWFRKAGDLPVLVEIQREAVVLLQRVLQIPEYGEAREKAFDFLRYLQTRGAWDPVYFVDWCETCNQNGTEGEREVLQELQEVEFDVLLNWTFRKAVE